MASVPKQVFVLGAGFTRAFLPEAPLLKDRYDMDSLVQEFKGFPHASRILELEFSRGVNQQIDIERLMTRLDSRMPYDFQQGADEELGLLSSHVKRVFVNRLEEAKTRATGFRKPELAAFASHCVGHSITCITFNYDDVFDQALFEVFGTMYGEAFQGQPYWHPDGGYGFFCKSSESVIFEETVFMDITSMLLLKLHGSINWRPRLGYPRPYSIDAIVHHKTWLPGKGLAEPSPVERGRGAIELHLEPQPFIVPPVLVKSALVEQPVLRAVWALAYQALFRAEQVVFVGYSLPATDLAANFLFYEALEKLDPRQFKVINRATDDEAKLAVMASYRNLFPRLADGQFEFRDALEWAREIAPVTVQGGT